MATVPEPRRPRCERHHYHLASCAECQAEMRAAREDAKPKPVTT